MPIFTAWSRVGTPVTKIALPSPAICLAIPSPSFSVSFIVYATCDRPYLVFLSTCFLGASVTPHFCCGPFPPHALTSPPPTCFLFGPSARIPRGGQTDALSWSPPPYTKRFSAVLAQACRILSLCTVASTHPVGFVSTVIVFPSLSPFPLTVYLVIFAALFRGVPFS